MSAPFDWAQTRARSGHRLLPRAGWRGVGGALCAMFLVFLVGAGPAAALKPITVSPDQDRIEITTRSEAYEGRGDTLPVETAPGPDGATDRIVVRSSVPGLNPNWLVFALHNPTEKAIEVWLTADRYNPVGSGIIWPDLDARRIEAVTHSTGYAPERIRNDRVDIFRLTIERGQTVTYVAELATDRFSRVYLWKPLEFEQRQRERFLFNGVMLGVMGLMAVFLTAVFAANHKMIFPSAALVAWCVLALLCVDFGFWHKLFQMRPEDNAQYRAAAEAAVAASLVIFLFTFLRVNLWHGFARALFVAWIVGQLAIVAIAVLDPRLAATMARLSIAVIGAVGIVIIGFLSTRRLERALALVPTWMLLLVWLFGAAVTLTGRLPGEMAISGLVAGLVLIMVLIGFTVTQFAFRSNEPVYGINPSQRQLKLAAVEQAGVSVWEWSVRRHEIKFDADVEAALGLAPGELPIKIDDFSALLHPADRERFELALQTIRQNEIGNLHLDLRLRHIDSSYRCFELEGATVPTNDRRALRCVGIARDVTDAKRSQERLLHNAVHDSLTGLPNRELFLDRVEVALARARLDRSVTPTVFYFDIDNFRAVNSSFGLIVGDSILLTVSRRLSRSLGPQDTLARIGGDNFALLVLGKQDPRELARMAEQLRLSLRAPTRIAGQEIVLTGAVGIAVYDQSQADARALLRDAEIAMYRAKRAGSDRLEIFKPDMRVDRDERLSLQAELQRAIAGQQLELLYQPVVALSNEELIGFDAHVRWQHPKLGSLRPAEFVPLAEDSDLIVQLGSWILGRVAADLARWHKELSRVDRPLFVNVNISSRQLVRPELAQEIRHVAGRAVVPSGSIRIAISEALVMENPEQATQILDLLHEAGVGLTLDGFGSGYSSPAFLARFPFDIVKIDRDLVQFSNRDEKAAAIVRSIVLMAHELGKRVMADGIERPEDAATLRALGCEHAQGFYYGEPMNEGEIGRLLKLIRKADRRMRRRGLVRGQEKRKANGTGAPSGVESVGTLPPALAPLPGAPRSSIVTVPTGETPSMAGARVRAVRNVTNPTLLPLPPGGSPPLVPRDPMGADATRRMLPTTAPRPGPPAAAPTPGALVPTGAVRPPLPAQRVSNPAALPTLRQGRPPIEPPTAPRPATGQVPSRPRALPVRSDTPRTAAPNPPALLAGTGFPAPQPRPLPTSPPTSPQASPQSSPVSASLAQLQAALETPASRGPSADGNAPGSGSRGLSSDVLASLARIAGGGRAKSPADGSSVPPETATNAPETRPKPAAE
jgi:diguanylate cyclase (GGDEF)-like protein